jgi:hypothetical protein
MSHRRRLEVLEGTIGARAEDSDECLECQGAHSYRRMLDHARLRVGAEGKLFGMDPEECRAKLEELAAYPDLARCPMCGFLNTRGELTRIRQEGRPM